MSLLVKFDLSDLVPLFKICGHLTPFTHNFLKPDDRFLREDKGRERGRKGGKKREGKREGEWIDCGSEGGDHDISYCCGEVEVDLH